MDHFSRECLHVEVGPSIGGTGVVAVLESLAARGRTPRVLQLDNGPEFRSRILTKSCHDHGVLINFITPGKPTQNGHIESLNGTFRNECLNEHWFSDLHDARRMTEAWRRRYNSVRPHSSLGGVTLREMYQEFRTSNSVQESLVQLEGADQYQRPFVCMAPRSKPTSFSNFQCRITYFERAD